MKNNFVDCFMIMGTALSLRGDHTNTEMSRPLLQDIMTTTVNISLTITRIHFKNLNKMEIEFNFFLHQRWIDPRLGANFRTRKYAINSQIWKPRITLTEGVGKENDMTQFWRGYEPDGNILYSEKISALTSCTTNFKKFPFDTQKCAIKIGTYRFPKEEVELVWSTIPVEILTGVNLREFELIDIITYSEVEIRTSGNFTVLVAQITIKRFFEHYLFCTIAPCCFLVILTYFVFWINPKIISIRYFLCIANLTLLIYFYYNSICTTMVLAYMKAIDIYIIICMVFVFISLLENLVVDIMFRKENDYDEYSSRLFHARSKPKTTPKHKKVDRLAQAIYPVLFIATALYFCGIFVI